jgi:hypothetical protein
VDRTHAPLDRGNRMLNHLAALVHCPGIQIEPALDRLQPLLMLPTRDPSLIDVQINQIAGTLALIALNWFLRL